MFSLPTKFQLNRIRTVGRESISKFQKARPYSATWAVIAKLGTERLCARMSSIILQSFDLAGHVIRRRYKVKISRGAPPQRFLGGNRKIRQ